jgi:hypothetical protein
VGASSTEIEEARNYLREAGYTVLKGELPEKAAYRRASAEGRTVTETRFTSLNRRAEALAQSVVNALASLTTRPAQTSTKETSWLMSAISKNLSAKAACPRRTPLARTLSNLPAQKSALQLKISPELRREFRVYAAERRDRYECPLCRHVGVL